MKVLRGAGRAGCSLRAMARRERSFRQAGLGRLGSASSPSGAKCIPAPSLPLVAMETFCETVQFYLKHLEESVYPVMTEEQFALKVFPTYRYFVTVWLRHHNPEVRCTPLRRAWWSPGHSSPACGAGRC